MDEGVGTSATHDGSGRKHEVTMEEVIQQNSIKQKQQCTHGRMGKVFRKLQRKHWRRMMLK
jgi:hypothetical protein